MTLALSKTLDPADYKHLAGELHLLTEVNALEGQHEQRKWEYGLALHAIGQWHTQASPTARTRMTAIDVGGSGSKFSEALKMIGFSVSIIDPNYNYPLERVLQKKPLMQAAVVTCISVLEHVPLENLDKFILALGTVVMPGGLLFLTCDYAEKGDHDPFHFHWMRAQIFDEEKLRAVADQLWRESKLVGFGNVDFKYNGPQVYDYTFASLCMQKENLAR